MKRSDEDRLDHLLARGRLSRPEKERMLGEIMRAKPAPARAWLRSLRLAIPALAALLLIPFFVLRLRDDGFIAKGEAGAARLEAGCVDGCRSGSTLLFRTADVTSPSVLAAWADDEHGQRVWYFPTEGGELPAVAPHHAAEALSRGVRIGAEHTASRYTMTMMLLPAGAYTRDDVLKSRLSRMRQPLEISK